MSKLPFLKFYPGDYILGTRSLTDTEKAIWVDLLCYMWLKPEGKGFIELEIDDLCRLLGRDRLTVSVTLNALITKDICNLKRTNFGASELVKVESRRMLRDAKSLKHNAKRQERHRQLSNAISNTKITPKKSEVRSQIKDLTTTTIQPSVELVVSVPAKPNGVRPLTDVQQVVKGWKLLTGVPVEGLDSQSWDRVHFARHAKSAKALIDLFGGWIPAVEAMEYVYMSLTARKLSCTLETIVKHSDLYREFQAKRPQG